MASFEQWKHLHDKGDILAISQDREGILWLKIKSIMRKDILKDFLSSCEISLKETRLQAQFKELFLLCLNDKECAHSKLNKFIADENEKILNTLDINRITSELYKLKSFDWGGDYNNSLDRYLVSHYVKAIDSYDTLISKFNTEINHAVQGYVLSSWYNHWSSVLIEHIFKSHPSVLPTVGKIKNVDFFINDIPFDLKVTYFPNEYMRQKRRERSLPHEIVYLKQKAKENGICFDKRGNDDDVRYEITEKMKDKSSASCLEALKAIQEQRMTILYESIANPKQLMVWLYENQGEMRFGSENRLFLVLVDKSDFNESWKLKRNIEILRPAIIQYLNGFKTKDISIVPFTYKGNNYRALSDIIFIVK